MKKTRVWLMAILLILQCCIMGCAQSDNGKDDAVVEVSSISTTAQTTVNTTMSNMTSASRFTIQTNVKGEFTIVKSATEMLDWIQSDDFADCTFKQTVRQLKLEHILSVQSSNEEFALERIEIYHNHTNIDYHFINRNNEEINWSVELPTENMTENYLKTRAEVINQANRKKYPTNEGPMLYAGDDVHLLGKSRQTYVREYGYAAQGCMHEPVHALFVTDIDGFLVEGVLDGSLLHKNWDNAYLNHFKFSYRDITMPTTNAATITTAASSGENDKEDTVTINIGEYFAASGKRMVDLKDVSKDEFLKKYPIILPENFTTVDFYYEIPTEAGLRFNEVEDGYVRCESNDGRSNLYVYVCDTKYIGHSCIWNRNAEPKKSRINNLDVIISQQEKGVYKGQFEKNGYYYTFETSNMAQQDVVSALKDLTKI